MPIEAALFGILGRDAESKTSKSGKAYLRLNVACSEGEATTWVNVTSFDPKAIGNVAGFVKGSRVYVEGKLSLSEWTGQDGVQHHGLSVLSWHTRLAEIGRAKPKREKAKPAEPQPAAGGSAFDDEIPFAPEWR
jgi:single-stranded DNA-binding protein